MQSLRRAAAVIRSIATVVATLAFAAVVVAFAYDVASRYVLNKPSDVAGEAAVVLYLWAVMIGGSLAVTLNEHISFDLLVDRLGPRAGGALEALGMFIAGAVLLYALPTTIDYVLFLWREKTAALELPLDKVYACFIVFQGAMAVTLLARAADIAFGLGRRDGGEGPPRFEPERGLP